MGLLFFLFVSFVNGSIVSYPLGLGRLGSGWHLGIGIAGSVLGWLIVLFLHLPGLIRIGLNGWHVYPLWGALGSLIIGMLIALTLPDERAERR